MREKLRCGLRSTIERRPHLQWNIATVSVEQIDSKYTSHSYEKRKKIIECSMERTITDL